MKFPLLLKRGCTAAVMVVALVSAGCVRSPEAKSAAFLDAGKKLLDKKDPARALLQFRNAAKATPLNAEAYFQIGQAYADLRDFKNAYFGYKRALELDSKHTQAQLRMAEVMASIGDEDLVKEAEGQLKTMTSANSGDAETFSTLAITQLKLGQTKDAAQSLEQALAKSPKDLRSSVLLAIAKSGQGDVKGAEQILKQAGVNSPASAEPHVILGEFYLGLNRMPDAESEFRRALEVDPKKLNALLDLAQIESAKGAKKEAEEKFKRIANSGEPALRSVYGRFLFSEGRQAEALSEFEKISRENPNDRAARTRVVAAYQALNRLPEAEKILAVAIKKNPKDLDALLQRGNILVEGRKYAEAEHDFNQVLGLNAGSADAHYGLARLHQARGEERTRRYELSKALNLNPNLLAVRLELVTLLSEAGEVKAALSVLQDAPKEQKNLLVMVEEGNWLAWDMGDLASMRKGIDVGLSVTRSPELLLQDGLYKLRTGNAVGAQAAIEEALKNRPTDPRALRALFASFNGKTGAPIALEKVKQYAAGQTNSATVQNFLGELLLANGQRDQARAAYVAAKAADPQSNQADFALVGIDVLDRKFDDARARLTKILASDGNNARANLWMGVIEQAGGEVAPAIEHYRRVVSVEAQNAQALNNLAYLLSERSNKVDEALGYAQKACEVNPTDGDCADTLGWILYHKGLYETSVKQLEKAASLRKDDPAIHYHLAMAYAKAGQLVKGRMTFSAALKLNPNAPEAQAARTVLAEAP